MCVTSCNIVTNIFCYVNCAIVLNNMTADDLNWYVFKKGLIIAHACEIRALSMEFPESTKIFHNAIYSNYYEKNYLFSGEIVLSRLLGFSIDPSKFLSQSFSLGL